MALDKDRSGLCPWLLEVIYVTPAHLIGASYGGAAWATKTKPVI